MTDADTEAFVASFLADVARLADPPARPEVAALLSDALERGGDAWRPLYRAVTAVLRTSFENRDGGAYARLQAFIDENDDLGRAGGRRQRTGGVPRRGTRPLTRAQQRRRG